MEGPNKPKRRNICLAGLYMFAITFKATVGTGILAIPYTVQRFGMLGAVVGLAIFAALSWYTMRTLLVCVSVISTMQKQRNDNPYGFEQPFEQPLLPVEESKPLEGPKSCGRKCWDYVSQDDHDDGEESRYIDYQVIGETAMGKFGSVLVIFSAVSTQLGSVVAYIIFMGNSLVSVVNHSQTAHVFQPYEITLMLAPVLMLLSLLRSARLLESTSHFGNLALVVGLGAVLYYGATDCGSSMDLRHASLIDINGISVFFGTAVFAFSAHCEVIMISQSLKSQEEKKMYRNLLLLGTMTGIAVLYLLFGSICNLFFGAHTQQEIFDNLPADLIVTKIVKVCMTLAMLFQSPITLLPAFNIIEQPLSSCDESCSCCKECSKNVIRICLVAAMCVAGLYVPYFDLVCSLIGSFSNGIIAFILPPLFYFLLLRRRTRNCCARSLQDVFNALIFVIGVAGALYCSYQVVVEMIQKIENGGVTNSTAPNVTSAGKCAATH